MFQMLCLGKEMTFVVRDDSGNSEAPPSQRCGFLALYTEIAKSLMAADDGDDELVEAELSRMRLLAYKRDDYPTALRLWLPLAAQGMSKRKTLGTMYDKGQGVPQNYIEAANWYRKAADQGNATAQWILSDMYRKGWASR